MKLHLITSWAVKRIALKCTSYYLPNNFSQWLIFTIREHVWHNPMHLQYNSWKAHQEQVQGGIQESGSPRPYSCLATEALLIMCQLTLCNSPLTEIPLDNFYPEMFCCQSNVGEKIYTISKGRRIANIYWVLITYQAWY